MPLYISRLTLFGLLAALAACAGAEPKAGSTAEIHHDTNRSVVAQLGPRPFFLVDDMREGPLKRELEACAKRTDSYARTDFSIGHRGAALQFPEHTRQSYQAAAAMGAGIIECDVAFTKDKELVCRHAQNDLHTTTNILVTPLASKCTQPFKAAVFDAAGKLVAPASAECRTSDITLAEFKSLRGKMDAFDPRATTAAEFLGGTAKWRTDLYAGPTSGTLMTHRESIALFTQLGVKMTPELKKPSVAMPFDGLTQEALAQKLIDEYKQAGISPRRVWAQSFNKADVLYWIENEPEFGRQAVYLDDAISVADLPAASELSAYKAEGINIVAPPLFALLAVDAGGAIVPSQYARDAKAAGLGIIAWTVERSGLLADGNRDFYYQTVGTAIEHEGDVMQVLDVLAKQVGVLGVFSDWPATVTFYANCKGLK